MGLWARALLVCLLVLLSAPGLSAQSKASSGKKRWIASAAALVAASVADGFSSRSKYELNPLLRNSEGRFSPGRALALKSACAGGALSLEWLISRRKPAAYRFSEYVNYGAAASMTAVALRNSRQ